MKRWEIIWKKKNVDKGRKRLSEKEKEEENGETWKKYGGGKKGGFGAPSLCVSLGVVALNAKLGAVGQAATTNARRGDFLAPFSLTLFFFCGFPGPAEAHFSLGTSGWWPSISC